MDITLLNFQEIDRLNEFQKYFYEHSLLFIKKLNTESFDLSQTYYKINKIKNMYSVELALIPKNQSEIKINIYVNPKEVILFLNGWHEHLCHDNISVEEFYGNLEKLLIFGLSKCCKIVIYKSNNKPYKWNLYSFKGADWKFYSSTGLLIYNFFGKKTKEEKQSKIFNEAVYPKELFSG